MTRRPDSEKPEIFSQKDLEELRYNLAYLSVDAVRRFYERAHEDCRMIYDRLPSPKQIQTLVQMCRNRCGCGGDLICNNPFMCGRYRLSRRKQIIEEHFDTISGDEDWTPRYNVAPTQPVPIIRQHPNEPRRELSLVRWGLSPSWAKDASGAAGMINARSESAAIKPAFRDALKLRRCLVPADGFYEWLRAGKTKQPYCFEVNDGELFAFAGLWERWEDPSGQWIKSCSIMTTTPNAVTSQVHDRMPVILQPDNYDLWLDPGFGEVTAVSEMLKPYDARVMRFYPVRTKINHALNDDAGCSEPIELELPPQGRLFA